MGVRQGSKHELVTAIRPRYARASRVEQGQILDEFVAAPGYHRKHAIRLLRHGPPPVGGGGGGRPRVYRRSSGGALREVAEASDWLSSRGRSRRTCRRLLLERSLPTTLLHGTGVVRRLATSTEPRSMITGRGLYYP